MMTIRELKERLVQQVDIVTLLEVLKISSEELVEAFSDKIEESFEQLTAEFDEDDNSCSE
jgi:hypothetical protein